MTLLWPVANQCIKLGMMAPRWCLFSGSTPMLRSIVLLCLMTTLSACGIVGTTVSAVGTVGSTAIRITGAAVDVLTSPLSD